MKKFFLLLGINLLFGTGIGGQAGTEHTHGQEGNHGSMKNDNVTMVCVHGPILTKCSILSTCDVKQMMLYFA